MLIIYSETSFVERKPLIVHVWSHLLMNQSRTAITSYDVVQTYVGIHYSESLSIAFIVGVLSEVY